MTEQEIETLVVRLTGDSSQFAASFGAAQVSVSDFASQTHDRITGVMDDTIKAAKATGYLAAEIKVLQVAYQSGVLTIHEYVSALKKAREEANQGAHSTKVFGMSILELRHAVHAVSMTGIIPHQASRGIMLAVYGMRMLGPAVDYVRASFLTLRGAMISTGIGALIVAVGILMSYMVKLGETHTEAAKAATKAFSQMTSGSKTAGEAMAGMQLEMVNKNMEKFTKWATDPAWNETGGWLDYIGVSFAGLERRLGMATYAEQKNRAGRLMMRDALKAEIQAMEALKDLQESENGRKLALRKAQLLYTEELEKTSASLDTEIAKMGMGADEAKRYDMALKVNRASLGQISIEAAMANMSMIRFKQTMAGFKTINEDIRKLGEQVKLLGMGAGEAKRERIVIDFAFQHGVPEWLARLMTAPARAEMRRLEFQVAAQKPADKAREMAQEVERLGLIGQEAEREKQIQEFMHDQGATREEALAAIGEQLDAQRELGKLIAAGDAEEKVRDLRREVELLGMGEDERARKKMVQDYMKKTGERDERKAMEALKADLGMMNRLQGQIHLGKMFEDVAKTGREADRAWIKDADEAKRFSMVQEYAFARGYKGAEGFKKALEETAEAMAQLRDAQDTLAAQKLWDETRTPLEKYQVELERLQGLYARGKISEDTYGRAVQKTTKDILGQNSALQEIKGSLAGSAEAAAKWAKQQEGMHIELNPMAKPSGGPAGLTNPKGDKAIDIFNNLFPQAVEALKKMMNKDPNAPQIQFNPFDLVP
jgi:hypothetical protein